MSKKATSSKNFEFLQVVLIAVLLVLGTALQARGQSLDKVMRNEVPGLISEVRGTGRYVGDCVEVNLFNKGEATKHVDVPIGLRLVPKDDRSQTMVTVGKETLEAKPGPSRHFVKSLCSEATKPAPSSWDTFDSGGKVSGKILEVLQKLNREKEFEQAGQQLLWHFTDGKPIRDKRAMDMLNNMTGPSGSDALKTGATATVLVLIWNMVNSLRIPGVQTVKTGAESAGGQPFPSWPDSIDPETGDTDYDPDEGAGRPPGGRKGEPLDQDFSKLVENLERERKEAQEAERQAKFKDLEKKLGKKLYDRRPPEMDEETWRLIDGPKLEKRTLLKNGQPVLDSESNPVYEYKRVDLDGKPVLDDDGREIWDSGKDADKWKRRLDDEFRNREKLKEEWWKDKTRMTREETENRYWIRKWLEERQEDLQEAGITPKSEDKSSREQIAEELKRRQEARKSEGKGTASKGKDKTPTGEEARERIRQKLKEIREQREGPQPPKKPGGKKDEFYDEAHTFDGDFKPELSAEGKPEATWKREDLYHDGSGHYQFQRDEEAQAKGVKVRSETDPLQEADVNEEKQRLKVKGTEVVREETEEGHRVSFERTGEGEDKARLRSGEFTSKEKKVRIGDSEFTHKKGKDGDEVKFEQKGEKPDTDWPSEVDVSRKTQSAKIRGTEVLHEEGDKGERFRLKKTGEDAKKLILSEVDASRKEQKVQVLDTVVKHTETDKGRVVSVRGTGEHPEGIEIGRQKQSVEIGGREIGIEEGKSGRSVFFRDNKAKDLKEVVMGKDLKRIKFKDVTLEQIKDKYQLTSGENKLGRRFTYVSREDGATSLQLRRPLGKGGQIFDQKADLLVQFKEEVSGGARVKEVAIEGRNLRIRYRRSPDRDFKFELTRDIKF